MKKYMKLIGSLMIMVCMAAGIIFAVTDSQASEETRLWLLPEGNTVNAEDPYYTVDANGVPVYDGYLFAGYYGETEDTYTAIKSIEGLDAGTYYAKFVPEGVLGIKAQVSSNIIEDEVSDTTKNMIRFVTTIDDSLDYQKVGFKINVGGYWEEDVEVDEYVYTTIYAVGATEATTETYDPSIFDSASKYFKTYTFTDIPESYLNTDITVTPYWVTLDGTEVVGTTEIRTANYCRSWYYVDNSTDAVTNAKAPVGMYSNPCTTIGDAVAIETTLDSTVVFKDNATDNMTVSETVDITKNVTLTSEGTYTLTRGSEFTGEFFYVSEDGIFTLKNTSDSNELVLDGAKSTVVAEKALIFADGTLNISEGVTLQNNAHGDGDSTSPDNTINGGAIYLDDTATLNMTGGTITGNEAVGNGGAIHAAAKSQMNLSNVTLSYNTAAGQGGAINLPAATAKDNLITLENVKINNNTATNWASGAIYVGNYRQIQIGGTSTEISGNTAKLYGGAIGAGTGAIITINEGTISGNTSSTGNGGAICLSKEKAELTITGGKFQNNTASVSSGNNGGGAIYALYNTTVEISDTEISSNTSKRRGGAIYLAPTSSSDHSGKLTLKDVTIKGNTTSNAAGAIFAAHGWDVEIDGATTEISGNTAGANGGAIVTGQYVNITMKAGTISGNTAGGGDGAGAIYFWGTATATTTFTMSGGTIKDNVDNSGKGAPNIRANNPVVIQLSGTANLASVCWQNGAGNIQVTAPLTAESVNTVITMPTYTAGTTAVSYTGTTETDMAALGEKFSLANSAYELSVSDKNLIVSEVIE